MPLLSLYVSNIPLCHNTAVTSPYKESPEEKIISKFGQNNDLENYFLASHDLINRLNISTYPTHILIDSQGNIIDNDVAINDVGSLIKRPN